MRQLVGKKPQGNTNQKGISEVDVLIEATEQFMELSTGSLEHHNSIDPPWEITIVAKDGSENLPSRDPREDLTSKWSSIEINMGRVKYNYAH